MLQHGGGTAGGQQNEESQAVNHGGAHGGAHGEGSPTFKLVHHNGPSGFPLLWTALRDHRLVTEITARSQPLAAMHVPLTAQYRQIQSS
jgi:hypothetical protein